MHPPSERLDSSSAAATSAVTFPSFDINAQHVLKGGTIIVCRQHCAPIMTIAGGTTRGISRPDPVSWNAAPASPAGARILWRRYPLHRQSPTRRPPSGLRRLSKVPSALCDPCITRRRQKDGPPGVEARRPCTTAWCDQISTPAENQLRFTVPSTDTVVLRLSLVSTNRHVADRSPLPERRGNNAQQPTNDREQA
jgi:hypothetical protein